MIDIDAVASSRLKYLTIEQAAEVLGVKPGNIKAMRAKALDDAAAYGLPVIIGPRRQVRIPRKAFLQWLKGGGTA